MTDNAGFLSDQTRALLDAKLRRYESQTGHQFLVWIGTSTGDTPIEDWAAQALKSWGVGRKGVEDGLVLFIFSADRRLRIEVGYGLEGVIPDVKASQIVRDVMTPRIRAGDRDGAVLAGVNQLIAATGGGGAGDPQLSPPARQQRGMNPLGLIILGLLAVLLLVFVVKHPALAFFLFANTLSGRRGGWGGGGGGWGGGSEGGGGGFSGGGGSSGGGGASGSW